MKSVIFIIIILSIGGFTVSESFSEILVHEGGVGIMTETGNWYNFSIQYPLEWDVILDENGVVNIMSDNTGKNGLYIILKCEIIDWSFYDQCNDENPLNITQDDAKEFCTKLNFVENSVLCDNYEIIDIFSWEINDKPSNTMVINYKFDEYDMNVKQITNTITYIHHGNDIWSIATFNESDKFDLDAIKKITSTLKLEDIHDQDDVFQIKPTSWLDELINMIRLVFNWI